MRRKDYDDDVKSWGSERKEKGEQWRGGVWRQTDRRRRG